MLAEILESAALGTETRPYELFGAFVLHLHESLIANSRYPSAGFFSVTDMIVYEDGDVSDDAGGIRWYWKYDPDVYKLEWEFDLPEKFLPAMLDKGTSMEGKIIASAVEGRLEGNKPFTQNYRLNGDVL